MGVQTTSHGGWNCVAYPLTIIAFFVWAIVSDVPLWHPVRHAVETKACQANLKHLGAAMRMYASDHGFPPAANWETAIAQRVEKPSYLHCPAAPESPLLSYAMSGDLATMSSDIEARATKPMLFDGRAGLVIERHEEGANYCYADGHVEWLDDPPAGIPVLSDEEQQ